VQINIRLAPGDLERLRALERRLQEAHGPSVIITPRVVMLEAMTLLEAHYDRLEKDRSRRR
jgi:hypothetical protein